MTADLTPEERARIYEEEKARIEAREQVEAEKQAEQTKAAQTGCMGCIGLIIAVPALFVLWAIVFPGEDDGSQDRDSIATMAFIQCQNYVSDRLVAPATADFPFLDRQTQIVGTSGFRISSYVDSENRLGANIRTNFICDIRYDGGDDADQNNWTLLELVTD